MESKILKKLKRQQRKALKKTPGEIWKALKSWERAKNKEVVLYGNQEVIQVGYTYVFKAKGLMREEDRKQMEERIREALETGTLLLDAGVELVDIRPHLKPRVKQYHYNTLAQLGK